LGGEKLKTTRTYCGVLCTTLFALLIFFGSALPLSAQVEPSATEALVEGELPAETIPVTGGVVSQESDFRFDVPPVVNAPATVSAFAVIRMVLVLALAALAIYGVIFFIKRQVRPQELKDPHLKLLARVPMGGDSYAAVLALGNKAWLVGGGSGGLNLISEVSDSEILETLLLAEAERNGAAAAARGGLNFRSLFQRLRGNAFANAPRSTSGGKKTNSLLDNSFAERLRKQRERLGG